MYCILCFWMTYQPLSGRRTIEALQPIMIEGILFFLFFLS
jgi:hypothetical protein